MKYDVSAATALLRRHGFPETAAEGFVMDLIPDEEDVLTADELRNELDTYRSRISDAITELDAEGNA